MDWRFFTGILFLIILLIGIPWATSETGVCSSKFVIDILKQENKDGAYNCFDLWINRYQTLFGAITTIVAAIYAGYWVQKQVKRTDTQIDQMRGQLRLSQQEAAAVRAQHLNDLLDEAEVLAALTQEAISLHDQAHMIRRRLLATMNLSEIDEFKFGSCRPAVASLKGPAGQKFLHLAEELEAAAVKCTGIASQLEKTSLRLRRIRSMKDTSFAVLEFEKSLRSFSEAQDNIRELVQRWIIENPTYITEDEADFVIRRFIDFRPMSNHRDIYINIRDVADDLTLKLVVATDDLIGLPINH